MDLIAAIPYVNLSGVQEVDAVHTLLLNLETELLAHSKLSPRTLPGAEQTWRYSPPAQATRGMNAAGSGISQPAPPATTVRELEPLL